MFFFYDLFCLNSISQGTLDAGAQRKVRELEEIVSKEKRQITELEHKYTLTLHQLDLATTREEQLRNESCELERNLALIKHELKEVWIDKNY